MGNIYKYKDLTGSVIGCALRIHTELGNGFQEKIYQRCLEMEFQYEEIPYAREVDMPLFYKEQQVGLRKVAFWVEEKVLVKLKAVSEVTGTHYNQILNYLTAYKLEVGLLINFGEPSLKIKRFLNHGLSGFRDYTES